MSLQEYSLRDASVFNSWLDDVNRVVVKVVINNAFSDSEILISILNNWLLEIGVEF